MADGNFSGIITVLQNVVTGISLLAKTIATTYPQFSTTATTATTGSSGSLPSQPAGYYVFVNPATGATTKIPYYNA